MIKRVGFACKWINDSSETSGMQIHASERAVNTGTTTVAWLNRQTCEVAEQRLWDLLVHNTSAIFKLVERIGGLDERLRMVRLSSDILPLYTERKWSYFWQQPDVIAYCEQHFKAVGDIARLNDVRLSFHPGQFCVLASASDGIIERSIEEFEYHTNMARWMGYGKTFQDFKINVHISGKRGPDGIREALKRLSPEARNCITIENDEMSWGVDASLELVNDCALVLDIHHHWIRTGEYIQPNDDRVLLLIDSWRGVRPTMHYSVSREDILVAHDVVTKPNHTELLSEGHNKQKLRAHSDWYWNDQANKWAASFNENFDIMCESKKKNLASFDFYENYCK